MSEARVIYCTQCGAGLQLDRLVGNRVVCDHCGHQDSVSSEFVRELAQYQAKVQSEVAQGKAEQQAIATMDFLYGGHGGQSRIAVWVPLALGPFILMMLVPLSMWLGEAAGYPGIGLGFGIAIVGVGALGSVAYLYWYYGGQRRKVAPVAVPRNQVACPSCGAAQQLEAGQWVERCEYCGAAMAPSAAAMADSVAAAHAEVRRLELEQLRAERQAAISIAASRSSPVVGLWIAAVGLGLVMGGASAYLTVQTFDPSVLPPINPTRALGMWCLTLASTGGTAAIAMSETRRSHKIRDAITHLTAQLGGNAATDPSSLMKWLDEFWCAPYPSTHFILGPYHEHVTGNVYRLPVLFDVSPDAFSPKGAAYKARMEILLAANWPDPAHLPAASELFQPNGFTLEVTKAGVRACGNPEIVKQIQDHPEAVLHLVQVGSELALSVLRKGGSPPAAATVLS